MYESIPRGLEIPPSALGADTPHIAIVPETPFAHEYERELVAFEILLPDLLSTRPNRFVAVLQGQIIDEDGDEFALAERVEHEHPTEFVLIRQVSQNRVEDHMDSPEVENP